MTSFYEDDLAYVHHVGFSDLAEGAGDELLALFRAAGLESGLVIDLGCGSGIWAQKLLAHGYSVLGVDRSAAMIELARRTAPEGEFHTGSLYDLDFRPCVAVTALGEALNYCVGETPPDVRLGRLFRNIAAGLQEGGVFAFDILVRSNGQPMQYRSWRKGPDWAVLVEVSEQPEENLLIRDITVFREIGQGYHRSEERHRVSVLDRAEIERLLADAGFEVAVSPHYGRYPLAQRRLAYIAYKR
jgi:SAM-dependent methyltransferase